MTKALAEIRALIGGVLMAYGTVAFICFLVLQAIWHNTAPHSAEPALGLVYPSNNRGSVTYISAFQATAGILMILTSLPLAGLGVVVTPRLLFVERDGQGKLGLGWKFEDHHRLTVLASWVGAALAPVVLFGVGPHLVKALNAAGIVLGLR